jgi:hypothetical protein
MSYVPYKVSLTSPDAGSNTYLSVSNLGASTLSSAGKLTVNIIDNTAFSVSSTGGVSTNGAVSVSTAADISNSNYSLNTLGGNYSTLSAQVAKLITAVNAGFNLSIS